MSLVTRITQAESLTRRKLNDLHALCKALGKVRAYVWRKYGSIKGVGKTKYEIQNEVRPLFKHLNISSHILGATILDAADDIMAARESAKEKVVRVIFRHTSDNPERKRLFTVLKVDKSTDKWKSWIEDKYLRRQMRRHWKHGRSKCVNQIVVPVDCHKWFEVNGRGFVSIKGFICHAGKTTNHNRYSKISIPLSSNRIVSGQIRVVINRDDVNVHYCVESVDCRPCGTATIGVDKGYTEVFVDSDGVSHGDGLGDILTKESDASKKRGRARRKLYTISNQSEPEKRVRIEKNNLGKKKWSTHKTLHKSIVSTKIHEAVHVVASKANVIAVEDLTKQFTSNEDLGPNANRRLSGWTKGVIASALKNVASRRGASVKLVNAAYTSQICPDCGCFGRRKGDRFYCAVCRDVKRSDHVSARNVLARLTDPEIKLYTPYRQVKEILLARSAPRLRLSNQDSSCTEVVGVSTESEELGFAKSHKRRETLIRNGSGIFPADDGLITKSTDDTKGAFEACQHC